MLNTKPNHYILNAYKKIVRKVDYLNKLKLNNRVYN